MLDLLHRYDADVTWVVFGANPVREKELRASAAQFLKGARKAEVIAHTLRDGFFPAQYTELKDTIESLKQLPNPDVIFTHHGADAHQDHRLVAELTWNTFRDHLILEYEIPKYDGGLSTPSTYLALRPAQVEKKIRILQQCYPSQHPKRWFTADTFRALMRLRGIESGGQTGWAEGFHTRKLLLR